jgi:hypothetical protein
MAAPGCHPAAFAPRARMLAAVLAAACSVGTLCACGSGAGESAAAHRARAAREARETSPQAPSACPATVLHTLDQIAKHVYREGVSSERTRAAFKIVNGSAALRQAIERGDAAAVQSQARALIATGRITNLRVVRGAGERSAAGEHEGVGAGQLLADAGGGAVAPLRGTITGAGGSPIATFVTSVWSDEGIVSETNGIAQSYTVLRANGRQVAGSLPVPAGPLPVKGSLSVGGLLYRYSSIAVKRYPVGAARIYLFRPASSFAALCGATRRDTLVNTLESVARVVYAGEIGSRARTQVRRVEADPALLRAVGARDREATRLAIDNLLTEHIVRLRVYVGGQLLMDVGGPYVLGPVGGVLNAGGRRIGTFVLSIQDDEGYLRLARRLGGMYVLMYMGETLVKNSLGPHPGSVPENGAYTYRGRRFQTFTLNVSAFPSGPLHIRVLVPIPYT